MRIPTPNEIEVVLNLPENSLVITELQNQFYFSPPIDLMQTAIAEKYLRGVPDDWIACSVPDWEGFMNASEDFFVLGLGFDRQLFTQIFNMLLQLRDKSLPAHQDSVEYRNLAFNLGASKHFFTPEQISEINSNFLAFGIPYQLN